MRAALIDEDQLALGVSRVAQAYAMTLQTQPPELLVLAGGNQMDV